MAETDRPAEEAEGAPRRGLGAKGWIATLGIAAALGGGGFYAAYAGLADAAMPGGAAAGTAGVPADSPHFLQLDPLMVTVGGAGATRQLRFRAFLEVGSGADGPVAALQPRILDIFATYLRAVPIDRLEDPTALLHLRAQLLRRVQLLAGPGAVSDLLIIDFVIA